MKDVTATLVRTVDDLEKDCEQKQRTISQLRRDLSEAEATASSATGVISQYRLAVEQTRQRADSLRDALDASEKVCDSLREQLNEARSKRVASTEPIVKAGRKVPRQSGARVRPGRDGHRTMPKKKTVPLRSCENRPERLRRRLTKPSVRDIRRNRTTTTTTMRRKKTTKRKKKKTAAMTTRRRRNKEDTSTQRVATIDRERQRLRDLQTTETFTPPPRNPLDTIPESRPLHIDGNKDAVARRHDERSFWSVSSSDDDDEDDGRSSVGRTNSFPLSKRSRDSANTDESPIDSDTKRSHDRPSLQHDVSLLDRDIRELRKALLEATLEE